MGGLFGGGGQSVPAVPPTSPPVAPNSQAVMSAEEQLRQQAARRKSVSSMTYAGATGGWLPASIPSGSSATGTSAPQVGTGATKTG